MARAAVEWIGNCCLIVACIAVTVAAARSLGSPPASTTPSQPGYERGAIFPAIDGVQFGSRDKTLILFVSTRCKYCDESLPFYQQLSESPRAGWQLVAIGSDPADALEAYLKKHSVSMDKVVSVRPEKFKLAGTPTMILTDRDGRVTGYWRGALRDREQEVLSAVAR